MPRRKLRCKPMLGLLLLDSCDLGCLFCEGVWQKDGGQKDVGEG